MHSEKKITITLTGDSGDEDMLEIQINGGVYIIPQFCPHRRGNLRYGHVNERNKTISCPLHRSTFSLETGEQISGPDCGSISVTKIRA
jgi:nitrite reductase/ring-hydroxylating ferredoxin subunit